MHHANISIIQHAQISEAYMIGGYGYWCHGMSGVFVFIYVPDNLNMTHMDIDMNCVYICTWSPIGISIPDVTIILNDVPTFGNYST